MAISLTDLARRHEASKARDGFTEIYEQHIAARRGDEVSALEIGIHEGASLQMWRDYFRRGRIVGIDIKPHTMESAGERTTVLIGDQTDTDFLGEVATDHGPFDLIVDDGGHRADQQQTSLTYLWQHLKPGGVYIVEDTLTSYLPAWGMSWRQSGTTMEFLKGLADDVHSRWHNEPVSLPGLDSIHFHPGTCILRRDGLGSRPPAVL